MAAASVTVGGTTIEVLTGDNFERWRLLMKSYLISEGLWDVVGGSGYGEDIDAFKTEFDEDDERRDAKALYAIQLSCAPHFFKMMTEIESARVAWGHLDSLARSDVHGEHDVDLGIGNSYLHRLVEKGDLDAINDFIRQNPGCVEAESRLHEKSVLHVAVIAGHEHIVEMLVNTQSDEFLEMREKDGYTALALVAQLNGNTKIARCMVDKHSHLLIMKTDDGEIPLLLASERGHRELTRYLYSKTPEPELTEYNCRDGIKLLLNCITAEIFDVALSLLQGVRRISTELSSELSYRTAVRHSISPLLLALADMPHVFPSRCPLSRWQRTLYQLLRLNAEPQTRNSTAVGQWFAQLQLVTQDLILLKVPVIRELYDKKLAHRRVLQIVNCLCVRVSNFNEFELHHASAYHAVLQAAKYGIVEFIESMGEANPNLLWAMDKHKRGVFSHAILNRQEKLFKFLLKRAEQQMRMIAPRPDIYGNNMLHHAAELGLSFDLDSRLGAALQVQREIQWFKEVEKIAHPISREARNANGRKPREVFTESHKELMEAGEKWAKETARSFTIVCTLIITIAFAAAFTVPGGSDQNTGIPIFLKKTLFEVFIMANAVSLITSSSSVLISIVILTSRYAEKDFEMRLPLMLMANLFFLFMSVAAMMVAFCAGIAMMLRGYHSLVRAIISLASLPIIIFVPTQAPLFFKIAKSTIGLKGFISILLLPYNVFIFILISPFLVPIYLIEKIKCCGILRFRVFARGLNFLVASRRRQSESVIA